MLYGIQTGFGSPQIPVAEIFARPAPRWCRRRTRSPRATTTWPFPTRTPYGRRVCRRRRWWSGPSPGWAPSRRAGVDRYGTRTPISWIRMTRRSGSRPRTVRVRVFSRCNATISMRVSFLRSLSSLHSLSLSPSLALCCAICLEFSAHTNITYTSVVRRNPVTYPVPMIPNLCKILVLN